MIAATPVANVAIISTAKRVSLMVERTGGGIEVTSLSETEWRFAAPLCEGQTFESAVNAAPDADVSMLFAEYLTAGRFIDFHVADNSNLLERHV